MEKTYPLSLEIYIKEDIESAIGDFGDVAKITLDGENLTIFGDSEVEINEVFREFMNYVLSL